MSVYLFDINQDLMGEVATVLESIQTLALNGTITGTVTAVYDPLIEQAIYFGSRDPDDNLIFHLYRTHSISKETQKITLTGIHIFFDDLQSSVIRDKRPNNAPVAHALGQILEDTGWEIGVDHATRVASGSYYYQSRLSAFWDSLERWNYEFKLRLEFSQGRIVRKVIDIYDSISADYGKWYEYGDTLLTVKEEQAAEAVYTSLIGLGKGEEVGDGYGRRVNFSGVSWSTSNGKPVDKPLGQDYVSLQDAVDAYDYREAVVIFEEIESPEELLQATYDELLIRSRPKVDFTATALETDLIELGETVAIIRPDMGIRYKTRVYSIKRDFLNRRIKSFSLGDQIVRTAADRIKRTAKEQAQQNQHYENRFSELLGLVTESYYNQDGYNYDLRAGNEYGLAGGYYSFDKPIDQDPTSVIYTGGGKLLIADSKNPDGSWNWKTFGTGSGLGAELITADQFISGSILARIAELDNIDAQWITTGTLDAGMIRVSDDSLPDVLWQLDSNLDQYRNLTDAELDELRNSNEELYRQIMDSKQGIMNLVVNSDFGNAQDPSTEWWIVNNNTTWGLVKRRYKTWAELKASGHTWGTLKGPYNW